MFLTIDILLKVQAITKLGDLIAQPNHLSLPFSAITISIKIDVDNMINLIVTSLQRYQFWSL